MTDDVARDLAAAIRELAQALRQQPGDSSPQDGKTYPARGLITHIRPTPDHRDTIGEGRIGFPPPKAGGQ